jgi:hypothetical protein
LGDPHRPRVRDEAQANLVGPHRDEIDELDRLETTDCDALALVDDSVVQNIELQAKVGCGTDVGQDSEEQACTRVDVELLRDGGIPRSESKAQLLFVPSGDAIDLS